MSNYQPTAFSKETCARLRGLIARYDVNQADLATICDVSQSQFSKIVRGLRPMTLDQLAALCYALDVDLNELVAEVQDFLGTRGLVPTPLMFVEDGERLDTPTHMRRAALDPWATAAFVRQADYGLVANSSIDESYDVPDSDFDNA